MVGTITQNKMTAVKFYCPIMDHCLVNLYGREDVGDDGNGNEFYPTYKGKELTDVNRISYIHELLDVAALCNHARWVIVRL